ncbi:MAG: ABC transporter ATP-binding protein [Lachnospiraceae bacterium]
MEEIIKVSHLKRYFKDVKAVDDVSFSVQKGELFGFLGENGAGKTTTISMLCTLLAPTGGDVVIDGFQLGKEDHEIKRHIGVVYQDNCLDDILTVKENLLLRGSLYETSKAVVKANLEHLCEILDLGDILNRRFGKLSGGQKRRCEIARALMHTPDILFLDEPTTGLDPASRKNVWDTIYKLQKEMRMTVFLTTHYMEEAARASHIGIMQKGHLTQFGTPFTLKEAFAKDKLILVPMADKKEAVIESLKKRGLEYRLKENNIHVPVGSTLEALPVIEEVKTLLSGFEVLQGTMDDVFLNVTAGEK